MAKEPELTIIIPTYNNPTGARELVSDFYRLHDPEMFRLISIDQTKDGIIFEEDKPVHLHIKVYRNLGFAKAMNQGWKLSTTKYTLLANDDVRLLHSSWYETAKAHLTEGVLAVNPFPALRTWDGGGEPKWYWEIHDKEKWLWTKDKAIESYTDDEYKRLQEMLSGGDPPGSAYFFTLFRTEARDIVGLLDEAYTNNAEDYDHNRRIFLTCCQCNKKKDEHTLVDGEYYCEDKQVFKSYKLLTCTHSLVHHECGVSKQNAAKAKEIDGYNLLANAKNIFNDKWKSDDCPNPDIYGNTGSIKPNTEWFTEVPL